MNVPTLLGSVKVFTVSELTARVKTMVENAFPSVWVAGEITGYKNHRQSGHWYFTLKDAGAVLPAAMFRGHNLRRALRPQGRHGGVRAGCIECL